MEVNRNTSCVGLRRERNAIATHFQALRKTGWPPTFLLTSTDHPGRCAVPSLKTSGMST